MMRDYILSKYSGTSCKWRPLLTAAFRKPCFNSHTNSLFLNSRTLPTTKAIFIYKKLGLFFVLTASPFITFFSTDFSFILCINCTEFVAHNYLFLGAIC